MPSAARLLLQIGYKERKARAMTAKQKGNERAKGTGNGAYPTQPTFPCVASFVYFPKAVASRQLQIGSMDAFRRSPTVLGFHARQPPKYRPRSFTVVAVF